MPKHQAPLCPICEPLLDCQVAHQHRSHHVGSRGVGLRLVLWVPVPGHVQKEETLRARVATRQERPPVVEPPVTTCATRPHTPFDLERVVPRFGDATDKSAVPPVAVPS